MTMTPITPISTGHPSSFEDDSPEGLITRARAGREMPTDHVIDESFAVAARTTRYFDPVAHRVYSAGRRHLDATLDYGPATPTVDQVRAERDTLRDALRALETARAAIERADDTDVTEAIAAHAQDRPHHEGAHGDAARRALTEADMAAAVALNRAQQGERLLTEAVATHALAIRATSQDAVDRDRAQLADTITRARDLVTRIATTEATLGYFEREQIAPLTDPTMTIDARPADAPPRWRAPIGSPHGQTVRDLLAVGRDVPRPPRRELDALDQWTTTVPWATSWRPDPASTSGISTSPAGI